MPFLPRPSLPIPCENARQGKTVPCDRSEIRAQAIDFAGLRAQKSEPFPVISPSAGKQFKVVSRTRFNPAARAPRRPEQFAVSGSADPDQPESLLAYVL